MLYTVKKVGASFRWSDIPTAKIGIFNWDNFKGYNPEAEYKIVHSDDRIFLRMVANNDYIKSLCCNINDIVCDDSCMEAFITPPGCTGYFNFEVNSNGALHLGFGKDRFGRTIVDPELIKKHTQIFMDECNTEDYKRGKWGFTLAVDKELFSIFFGKPFESGVGKGNFYKCGLQVIEHYIASTEISTDHPDFHRPEFFGDILFE